MSGRRVLMITLRFPPAATVSVFRTLRFVKYLPDYGWDPLVLAAELPGDESGPGEALLEQVPQSLIVNRTRPWSLLPRWNGHSAEAADDQQGQDALYANGSPQHPAYRRTSYGWLKRLPRTIWRFVSQTPDNYVSWTPPAVRSGLRIVRQHQPQLLYTSGPPHSTHLIGYSLKRLTGLPWVADFRDPWARKPWGSKSRNPWGEQFAQHFESLCVRAADRVVLNTERMADEFRAFYAGDPRAASSKFQAIPNGCDPDLTATINHLTIEPASHNGNGTVRLCHPGSLYRMRDPRPLIDAIGQLSEQGLSVAFEQIGHCDPSFQLQSYAAARGVADRVTIEPPIPHADVLRRMAAADLLLLIQPGTSIQIPGKLFEMLPFRKPILGLTDEGEAADILRRFDLGAVANGNDSPAIAAALRHLIDGRCNDPNQQRWADAIAAFDGRELAGRLAAAFDSSLMCDVK
jgi:hypothetical protein